MLELVWAAALNVLCCVAVVAEKLKVVWILKGDDSPVKNVSTSLFLAVEHLSVFRAVLVDMINQKERRLFLAAAGAFASVSGDDQGFSFGSRLGACLPVSVEEGDAVFVHPLAIRLSERVRGAWSPAPLVPVVEARLAQSCSTFWRPCSASRANPLENPLRVH